MSRNRRARGRGRPQAPSPSLQSKPTAPSGAGEQFIASVAEEMALGIERALSYWLGRIERQLGDPTQTAAQRISSVDQILAEFKGGRARLATG